MQAMFQQQAHAGGQVAFAKREDSSHEGDKRATFRWRFTFDCAD